ncbi:hypothetical protein DICPUDRAFT_89547 [Dictyostelium purpureum]|uniref:CENP-V/GFA domain-containing protein n=1 Tax=Dictyostelium purpureum TaxID=5786 RepID=F0ZWI7_DICPU|nr:uncharacterized protein DICPUDRAFT_89547 [Dictyostelium purpureum]EGC31691.1 hypothetical protein DICPUDRAFT_89547 [Dictyostelium purpureum]|eukprot:XP_003291789.1 hypothetical protein DICPUDRAFT_89547 [Dictyostelium purpureum]
MENNKIKEKLVLHGACHCKKVKYTCSLNVSNILDIISYKCNCSICSVYRFWEILIKEKDMVEIKKESLKEYKFEPFNHIHYFCSECGTHPFGFSKIGVEETDNEPFYFINVPTIIGLTPEILEGLNKKVRYLDGESDNFKHEPSFKSYL